MIYLYAVTGPIRVPPQGSGLNGAPLEAVPVEDLNAIFSTHDRLELRATAEECWDHERAVETVMRSYAVLPVRFGTTFSSIDALRAAVTDQAPALAARLAELDGCVELAVRIGPLTPDLRDPACGREYLLGKLSARRRREALAEATLACLSELALASRLITQRTPGETVSISYLVRGDEVERFARAVGRLVRRWPQFSISCTGPWAPYSFVAAPTSAERQDAANPSGPRVPAEVA